MLSIVIASSAQAQKKVIEFTFVPDTSLMRITGVVNVDNPFTTDPIPFTPQKDGTALEPTLTGYPSEMTFLGESPNLPGVPTRVTAIVDFTNNRLQVLESHLITEHSGEYCPGDGSDTPMNTGDLDQRDPPPEHFEEAEECPYEEPGSIAVSLGIESAGGSLEAVVRDANFNVNGASDIVGTEIDTLNWHLFLRHVFTETDGTGGLDWPENPEGFPAAHGYANFPLRAGHNETDPSTSSVNESTYFKGLFEPTGNPDEYRLEFPIHVPAYLGNEAVEDPDPDQFIALVIETADPNDPTVVPNGGGGDTKRGVAKFLGTVSETLLEGDANRDGVVDGLDTNIVSRHWRKGEGHMHDPSNNEAHSEVNHAKYGLWGEGDVDLSTIVDQDDMDIIAGNFGATSGGGSTGQSVPEPASAGLAAIGLVTFLFTGLGRRGRKARVLCKD